MKIRKILLFIIISSVLLFVSEIFSPSQVVAQTITPTSTSSSTYTITGNFFYDTNGDLKKDNGEVNTNYIDVAGCNNGTLSYTTPGQYRISIIGGGTCTINYGSITSPPAGYQITYPSGNPHSFTVTIGSTCNVDGTTGGTCSGGNISNLNIPLGATAAPTLTPTPTSVPATYKISGTVFVDANNDGKLDNGESPYKASTITISLSGPVNTFTTTANGAYTFSNLPIGTYTLTMTVPAGYNTTSVNPATVTVNANATQNFGVSSNVCTAGSGASEVMLMFDHSQSMADKDPATGNTKISEAIKAAQTFLNLLNQNNPGVKVGLIEFAAADNYPNLADTSVVVPLIQLSSNYSNLSNAVNQMKIASTQGTCFDCAVDLLNKELKANSTPSAKHLAILLTDGKANEDIANGTNNVDPTTAENAAMNLVNYGDNNLNIDYYTVGVGNGNNIDPAFLQQIANSTGGQYFNDPTNGDLTSIYTQIAGKLNTAAIKGMVYKDANNDGKYDTGDTPLQGWTVQNTGPSGKQTATSDNNGKFSFGNLCIGQYTTQETLQSGWIQTQPQNPNFWTTLVTSGNSFNNINFGNLQGYTVLGSVFVDVNKNTTKDSGEPNYTGLPIQINTSAPGATVSYPSPGTFKISGITTISAPISVQFTNASTILNTGYQMIYPLGTPPAFSVTVGPSCNIKSVSNGAQCDASGNISNLNFAISNSYPWMQSSDLNIRDDFGFSDNISSTSLCTDYTSKPDASSANPGYPGIIFSGQVNAFFWQGKASKKNWIVGSSLYPEVFQSSSNLKTEYDYLLSTIKNSGATITDFTAITDASGNHTCNNLSNCSLPPNLAPGVYQASGDVILTGSGSPVAYTFSANNGHYIFLVNGNITIKERIVTPNGTNAIFSSAGNIIIDKTVGASSLTCNDSPGEIQGIYSADNQFIVDGYHDCVTPQVDSILTIEGTVIANAARQNTQESFIFNNRDLCGNDPSYPVVFLRARPDFILSAPDVVKQNTFVTQEALP